MDRVDVGGVVRVEPIQVSAARDDLSDVFAALTPHHLDRAYRLAWAILGNDEEAQDATQDALTVAWRQRRSLRDPDNLEAWLGRIS